MKAFPHQPAIPLWVLVSLLLFLSPNGVSAQLRSVTIGRPASDPTIGRENYRLSFSVVDNFTDARINNVKAWLMTKDSMLVDTMTAKYGNCSFKIKRDKNLRSCIIKLTHPDYQTSYSTHSLKSVGKQNRFNLPDLDMKRKSKFKDQILDELVVTATKVKMFYRGDTIVYNADAFNVAEGSMLDALIKQMPGTELTKEGEIFVNGRKVENLLLNGKDFFRGKNKLMLENLPYYTVKEIKVYDQTPERALALNDDRVKKDFVMDVNLKREYSKGYMADVELGAGTEDGYLARLFGLHFTDISRLAIVGGANNLNMSDYALSGFNNNSSTRDGRTSSKLLTAELRTDTKQHKNVLTVELRKKKAERGSDVLEETFHNDASTFSTTQSTSFNKNLGTSLTNSYTLKVPFWLESTTNVRYNSQKDDSDNLYYESGSDTRQQGMSVLDSLFCLGVALNDPSMISARKRWTKAKAKEYGASQSFDFSKNLYSGDIITFFANAEYTKNTQETNRFNRYLSWKPSLTQTNQSEDIDRPNTHVGARTSFSYKNARLFYDTDINFFINYHFKRDKDNETITDALSLTLDAENSYRRKQTEHNYGIGLQYHYDHHIQDKKIRTEIRLNLPLSITDRHTSYSRYTLDTCLTQSPVFFEPSLTFDCFKWKGTNSNDVYYGISLSSNLNYSLPEATQLVTLPVTSDKINIYEGNARLKSPADWSSRLVWNWPLKSKRGYLRTTLSHTRYLNRIINTYRYDAGVYTHRPENINGTWDMQFNHRGQHFFALFDKYKITFNWSLNSSYRKMKNFIADGATGKAKLIDNEELRINAPLRFSGYINKLNYSLSSNFDWRKRLSEQSSIDYKNAFQYTGEFYLSTPVVGFDLESDWEIIKRQGYSNDELNKWTCTWNMSLSKAILKNKIGLKLTAVDILHQYKSLTYVINERGISETHAVSLPSYLLFSVTYHFNKQPKKK